MEKFAIQSEQKIIELLSECYGSNLPYGEIKQLLKNKDIKLNGSRISENLPLKEGDLLEVFTNAKTITLTQLYCDENIIIMNKPSGIRSENYFMLVKQKFSNAYFTHRLDVNTSGIIVFALNQVAYLELCNGFKNRKFEKYYYCLVYGKFEKNADILQDYLFKDAKRGKVYVYSKKVVGSQPIKTGYEQLKSGNLSSVLRVCLYTGRTHQIRAHLAHYGHFIIGDGKYGNDNINKQFNVKSQVLQSAEIKFNFNSDSKLYYLNQKVFKTDCSSVYSLLK